MSPTASNDGRLFVGLAKNATIGALPINRKVGTVTFCSKKLERSVCSGLQ